MRFRKKHTACKKYHDKICLQVANYLVDRLGKKCVTAELLQPDELISGMISQVAAEPEMALLLNHFIYSTHGPCRTFSWFLTSKGRWLCACEWPCLPQIRSPAEAVPVALCSAAVQGARH